MSLGEPGINLQRYLETLRVVQRVAPLYCRVLTTFPPRERCLDCQIGSLAPRRWTTTIIMALRAYFGYPQTWKAHLVVLSPHLPPPNLRPPPQSLCHLPPPPSLCPLPLPQSLRSLLLEPRCSKRILSIPSQYAILAGRSPLKPRRGGNM
jgi:hypothetical protein